MGYFCCRYIKDWLQRSSVIDKLDGEREYAEFMHLPRKRFIDFGNSSAPFSFGAA